MRERDLAAARARVERIEATGKASLALGRGARKDADRLLGILRQDGGDLDARYLLGWLLWYRYSALTEKDRDVFDAAAEMLAPCFIEGIEPLPEPLLPLLVATAASIGSERLNDPGRLTDPHRLSADIGLWRRIVAATPVDSPHRAAWLAGLGLLLWARLARNGDIADADEAIAINREAVALSQPSDPDTGFRSGILCFALSTRFVLNGDVADLDEAIEVGRGAVALAAAEGFNSLLARTALANTLMTRFRMIGADKDLDEAIVVSREATKMSSADDPDEASAFCALGGALLTRFEWKGDMADINEAIAVCRTVAGIVPADSIDRSDPVFVLGEALKKRAFRTGSEADLSEAITYLREALTVSAPNDARRHGMLSSLAGALHTRCELTGDLIELDEAITIGREAIAIMPRDHFTRPIMLANLARAVETRFRVTSTRSDLDQAIVLAREAAEAVPADHTNRAEILTFLGSVLQSRFVQTESRGDIDAAVSVCRTAVAAAVRQRAAMLLYLSQALGARFEAFGEPSDGDEAVAAAREAVAGTPADHSRRAHSLGELGRALRVRFKIAGDAADLDESIATWREAVECIPADNPDRIFCLNRLGEGLSARFKHAGAPADRDEAVAVWSEAANARSMQASWRIVACWAAAVLIAGSDPSRAAALLDTAVRLLPETAPRHLQRGDQQHALGEHAGLATDAAALTLMDTTAHRTDVERAAHALRLLELGRGVVLSQVLDTRTDIAELKIRHPVLAARFTELRDRLDADDTTPALPLTTRAGDTSQDWGVDRRRRIATAFESTIAEIRALDGFETFLLPPEPGELVRHATRGPIVVLNVSRFRSDALLLTADGIRSLQLPGVDPESLVTKVKAFHEALERARDLRRPAAQRQAAQHAIAETLEWLWDRITGPVLNELGYQNTPPDGTVWPRIWWVPCGPLSLLPIHAAGYHRQAPGPNGRHTVMDRVVSSYTPTVRALGHAREHDGAPAAAERALIVAIPATPDAEPLRHAAREAALIRSRFTHPTVLIGGDRDIPTAQRVLDQLPHHPIAHFACHGTTDHADPAQSRLLLHDHQDTLLTVARLAAVRLDQTRLVYLSACATASKPASTLVDEAINLTTAFQLVGYPHVIGTLWEVDDGICADIADAFYDGLSTGDGCIDTSRTAHALHRTVRAIRDRLPATPSLWAGYLHAGA